MLRQKKLKEMLSAIHWNVKKLRVMSQLKKAIISTFVQNFLSQMIPL